MADVLSLLRAAVSAGQRVERAEDDLLFAGGKKFPCSTLTSYMRARGTGDAYTLGTVWFYCQEHAKSSLGAYLAAVREAGEHVTTVEQVDQNDMLTYVSGQSGSSVAVMMVHVDLDDFGGAAEEVAALSWQSAGGEGGLSGALSDWTIRISVKPQPPQAVQSQQCGANAVFVASPITHDYLVHRSVLATGPRALGYFQSLFQTDAAVAEREAGTSVLELAPSAAAAMPQFLEFIYTGEMKVTTENTAALLHLAQYLRCKPAHAELCKHVQAAFFAVHYIPTFLDKLLYMQTGGIPPKHLAEEYQPAFRQLMADLPEPKDRRARVLVYLQEAVAYSLHKLAEAAAENCASRVESFAVGEFDKLDLQLLCRIMQRAAAIGKLERNPELTSLHVLSAIRASDGSSSSNGVWRHNLEEMMSEELMPTIHPDAVIGFLELAQEDKHGTKIVLDRCVRAAANNFTSLFPQAVAHEDKATPAGEPAAKRARTDALATPPASTVSASAAAAAEPKTLDHTSLKDLQLKDSVKVRIYESAMAAKIREIETVQKEHGATEATFRAALKTVREWPGNSRPRTLKGLQTRLSDDYPDYYDDTNDLGSSSGDRSVGRSTVGPSADD
eukprot:COSAG05_NODE_24_length_31553_cov_12.138647_29_plen_613_part_00